MDKEDTIVLQWVFSPTDYFEAPAIISQDGYQITIENGNIEAKMETSIYETNRAVKDAIEDALIQRFRGVQLFSHQTYELSYNGGWQPRPDGLKYFFKNLTATLTPRGELDIIHMDKNGNVKYDSRLERIQRKRQLADQAEKYGGKDTVARALLSSYDEAVKHPDHELVHLYEIREALAAKFSGSGNACRELGASKSDWDSLGNLANNKPIKQGRHRGKFTGNLRDATPDELRKVREIARDLVIAYLKYLEQAVS